MTRNLRFGLLTAQLSPWPALLETWQQAEAMGFDSLWLGDHIVFLFQPDAPFLEGWSLLPALAAHTSRVRVGVLVSNVLFRNPVVLAKQAATVDHISRGRLELALGSGNAAPSYSAAGIDAGSKADRMARLAEAVDLVDRLLRDDVTSYTGRYYRAENAIMQPPPVQTPRPRLTVAAHRPESLKVAARHADVWHSLGGFGIEPDEAMQRTRIRGEQLDEFCLQAGRDPLSVTRSFLSGLTTDMPWASVEAFRDFVGRYQEMGITEFNFLYPPNLFSPPEAVQPGIVERVAYEVIPALRAP
jgi:alkanesulfonate monooxygenase SsuD/methylene tetrahydromethanopterin reductase-like flavin-dependent oxidoreductase (luciferase family)